MLIKMIRISQHNSVYSLKEVFINPKQITYIYEDEFMKKCLHEGTVSLDLHPSTSFTKIRLDGRGLQEEFTVIGDPNSIKETIRSSVLTDKRELLKG